MESLIHVHLQSPPTWLKRNSIITQPIIPSTFSPLIQKRKLRTNELHAKRRRVSDPAVSVSEMKRVPKEEKPQENRIAKNDDEIPKPVFDRMLQRIAIAVGLPIGLGMSMIFIIDKAVKEQGLEFPAWAALFIVLVSFGTGSLGMAYGTLSASWDPDKEGSFLGFEQIQKNWPVLWKEELEKERRF
ncbi:PAM68-like protein (DUF3464) [Rhynchospora pubera]|uniref:PAM68-like protein (DUF3464) n=1 Tax=Rhynchospora pubera TaxID=906938 RepID=A0AAV8E443_9POAL|nr:PAM68-like protein (DUF3464) [Rhynchospora pubera]